MTSRTGSWDVVVVGGGLIGCSIAFELTKRGRRVAVIERGPIGREASWASAGIISLPNKLDMSPERVEITRRGLHRYPELVAELEAETGLSIDYRPNGAFAVGVDEGAASAVDRLGAWQREHGFRVEKLDTRTARELDPSLPEEMAAVWFAPEVGALSVYRLTLALAAAAKSRGAMILAETPVVSVIHEGGRVTGVRLPDGHVDADTVILATGAWTRFLGDALGVSLPTRPVKGQLIAFANPPIRPRYVIAGHGGYIVPRVDGTVVAAATEEEVGFDRRVTGEGVTWLLELARSLCPTLPAGEIVSTWTGLRPGSEDREPLIGPIEGYAGLWVAAGHFRTGAKEAPGSAELVASALVSGRTDPLLARFAPDRMAQAATAVNHQTV